MRIANLFERDIFRPINGVVKADQIGDDGHEARVRDGGERGDARDSIRTLWC
ncbi:MAG: hypothetical protein WBP56_08195 [Polyangia bacterium]